MRIPQTYRQRSWRRPSLLPLAARQSKQSMRFEQNCLRLCVCGAAVFSTRAPFLNARRNRHPGPTQSVPTLGQVRLDATTGASVCGDFAHLYAASGQPPPHLPHRHSIQECQSFLPSAIRFALERSPFHITFLSLEINRGVLRSSLTRDWFLVARTQLAVPMPDTFLHKNIF